MMTVMELELEIMRMLNQGIGGASILSHDQAQRVVIDRYREKVDDQAADIIDHIDAKHKLNKQIEQQAKEIESHKTEIARLKNELSHWTFERFNQLGAENKTLREALQLLYDTQNGCPLPKYEADWTRAMELAEQVLKEVVG